MPLVRYEVRCEHSLANPELFRSAARDDPEGLLEGVAMAGLVGIVRQLGDLAEFAAEIFRDLHTELTSVGGRAHDLTVRVQQLEAELPAVEKALLSEPNQLRFAYTNGADWHASIRSDQNHCTSGELPRFVRNFYEECRGPPRLFLLDKFDVTGPGACLKRYSDPSFFKLEWARSELMKAQRAQRDKKARREKKKARRRKTGQPIAAINQIPARVRYGSATLEDLDSLSHLLAPTLKNEVGSPSLNRSANHTHATQTQRRSNLGSQNKVVGGRLPPSGVSAPQAEGGALKPLKISAKDIEANVSGKFRQPNDMENVAESMAGKISKIIEMEDCEAVYSVGLVPRNVGSKSPKGADGRKRLGSEVPSSGTERVIKENLEAAAVGPTGNTPRGVPRGNASLDGREGSNPGNWRVPQSSMPDVSSKGDFSLGSKQEVNTSDARTSSRVPDDTAFSISQANSSRTNSMDVRDTVQLSGNVLRRYSVDAKEADVIAPRSSRQDSGSSSRGGNDLGNATAVSTSENPSGVKGLTKQVADTSEAEDRHENSHHSSTLHNSSSAPTGNQFFPNHGDLENKSYASHGVDDQRNNDVDKAPVGDGAAPSTADNSEGLVLSASVGEPAFHHVHRSEVQRRANVDTNAVSVNLEETVYQPPHLPPVRIEEVFTHEEESHMISATSPKISSQWSSLGEDDLRPSSSMLSRLSYSSELMPVSSGSEPESPVSPNSPAVTALYSPPGSAPKISGLESPPVTYVGSFSRTAHHPGYSSPRSEVPVLSLSPSSRLALPSLVPWADQGDDAGPSRPPPLPENSSHLQSRQEVSSVESQLYPLPSLPSNSELNLPIRVKADGLPSQSSEGLNELISPQENAQPASPSSDNPDPLHTGEYFEAPSVHFDQMQPSITCLEAEVRPPSTTSIPSITAPSRSSPTSSFGLTESTTMQPSYKSFANFDPQHGTNVVFNRPTSNIDLLTAPVGELEADSFSVPHQGAIPNPASRGVFVHATPNPLRRAINIASSGFPMRDEDSVPSSPTGSVIIKDTPSPLGSPASNYSETESEIHEYHSSQDQPRSPVSPRSVAHALEEVINHGETSSPDIGLHQDLRFKSYKRGPTPGVSIQETRLTNPASENIVHAAHSLPEVRVEAHASDTLTHLGMSHEETLLQAIPRTTSHLASEPTSPPHSSEAAALRSISMTTSAPKSLNNSASNSPPDTPLGEEYIAGEDEASATPSRTSGRSASNSPPTYPPKFLDHASSLRWRGRSDPASLKPDFSLPPNLVCRSETSSPPCSPPPPSDLESPKEWDEVSESSTSLESSTASEPSDPAQQTGEEAANVEVYRLPESPLPPDSPTISDEGDRLPGPSSRLVFDEEDDIAREIEHETEESTTARPALGHPSDSFSDKSTFEGLSSAPEVSHDSHQPSDAQFNPSTFEPPTETVLLESLPQVDISQESAFESQTNPNSNPNPEAHEPPTLPSAPGSAEVPTKDALAAAIAHHDWNTMKALANQNPGHRPLPPPDERNILLEQMGTKSLNLPRTDSMENNDPVIRPSANINVAAILEKANAIRRAFVGSDDEGDEDDWSDS